MSLNLKEKSTLAENALIQYYKQTVIELEEKNKVLEMEIELLKDLNTKYHKESSIKDENIRDLKRNISS